MPDRLTAAQRLTVGKRHPLRFDNHLDGRQPQVWRDLNPMSDGFPLPQERRRLYVRDDDGMRLTPSLISASL